MADKINQQTLGNAYKRIEREALGHRQAQDHPHAILLGGQSGSGKYGLANQAESGLRQRGGSIVVDERHVETGSFNYSDAAARKNSENVLVLWNNPKLASAYLKHWERNWNQGAAYHPGF